MNVILLAMAALLFPNIAHAAFVPGYQQWDTKSNAFKSAYVAGVLDDYFMNRSIGEQQWLTAERAGINGCTYNTKMNTNTLVKAVDQHYLNNLGDWDLSPSSVLRSLMDRICISSINAERAKLGLKPWEAQEGPIDPQ